MERFSFIPFSIGCVSQSSVQVVENQPRKAVRESSPLQPSGAGEDGLIAKVNIGDKIQKIVKGLKSLPQKLQLYKGEEEEEEESEMEIGPPTNVLHVSHIGWNDDATSNTDIIIPNVSSYGWDRTSGFLY